MEIGDLTKGHGVKCTHSSYIGCVLLSQAFKLVRDTSMLWRTLFIEINNKMKWNYVSTVVSFPVLSPYSVAQSDRGFTTNL